MLTSFIDNDSWLLSKSLARYLSLLKSVLLFLATSHLDAPFLPIYDLQFLVFYDLFLKPDFWFFLSLIDPAVINK